MVTIAYGDGQTPIYPRCVPPSDGAGVLAPLKLGHADYALPHGEGSARGATGARFFLRAFEVRACTEGSWGR